MQYLVRKAAISTAKDLVVKIQCPFEPIRQRFRRLYYNPKIQKIQGYHFGIICCAAVSAAVLIVNTVVTIWGWQHYGIKNSLGTIREGSCTQTKNLATRLHLVINILSTLLLGASNYSMQCLSAPTRHDIDQAHAKRIRLDIGTTSLRNLLRISRCRATLWLLIAISSVPFHLLYNSAVFTTLFAQEYDVLLVTSDFLDGTPFDTQTILQPYVNESRNMTVLSGNGSQTIKARANQLYDRRSSLQRLNNKECLRIYFAGLVSSHSDVLVISSYPNKTNSMLFSWPQIKPNLISNTKPWCYDDEAFISISYLMLNPQTWHVHGWEVEYCLSAPVDEHCKVQFNVQIMIAIIVCNLCKLTIMGYVAWKRPQEPLVTLGDAIASFLDQPDLTTKGNCLSDSYRFYKATVDISFNHLARFWTSEDQVAPAKKRELNPFPIRISCSYDSLGHFLDRIQHEPLPIPRQGYARDQGRCDDLHHWAQTPIAYEARRRFWLRAAGESRWFLILFL